MTATDRYQRARKRAEFVGSRLDRVLQQHTLPTPITGDQPYPEGWLAWTSGAHTYIDPLALHHIMGRLLTPRPSESEVWRQVQLRGGEGMTWAGQPCWRIPTPDAIEPHAQG